MDAGRHHLEQKRVEFHGERMSRRCCKCEAKKEVANVAE
jgi:hypothetical protein